MSSFTAPLTISPAPPDLWATTTAFAFYSGDPANGGLLIEVAAGTVTDLGTIPRWLWWLLPRDDPRWAAAFVLHDELCRRLGFSRIVAASIFLEALFVLARTNGTPRGSYWRIWTMYLGVMLWALLRPYPAAR